MNTDQLFIAHATGVRPSPGRRRSTPRTRRRARRWDVATSATSTSLRRGPPHRAIRLGSVAANERRRARADRVEARRSHHAEPRRDGPARDLVTRRQDASSTPARSRSRSPRRSFRYYAGWATRSTARRSACARTPSPSRCASRSAWSARSCRGTSRSCSRRGRSRRPWPPATRWCSSRASLTPLTALKFAELTREAGLPDGVSTWSPARADRSGWRWFATARVDKIAFTGSTEVGQGGSCARPPAR